MREDRLKEPHGWSLVGAEEPCRDCAAAPEPLGDVSAANPITFFEVWDRIKPWLVGFATLVPLLSIIYYLSHWLRYEGEFSQEAWRIFVATIPWFVLVKVAIFAEFRIPRNWGRYVTFYDLTALVQAATVSLLLLATINHFFLSGPRIPRSVFVLDWGTTIVIIGGIRAALRMVRERSWLAFFSSADKIRTLIVGANDAGESLLRTIRCNRKLNYHVVGFIDTRRGSAGATIGGVPVIGTVDAVCAIADRHEVRQLLIAAEEMSGLQIRKLVEDAREHAIQVRVLPGYEQLISGQMAVQPRLVAIQDLLRREPVNLDLGDIRQWIDDRVLLVTGSAGSIGSEICRQLMQFSPRRLVMIDRAESGQFFLEREMRELAGTTQLDLRVADVLDEPHMARIFEECHPDVVFHAAAYKHVPLMEAQPGEAVKNILLASRRTADLAMQYGVGSFVMISTDKAVNPTSVMGVCKRAAELYVQSQSESSTCRFVTVRFGNVLDSAGSVVQVFREQIARGGPVTVTDPRIERFFMTIPEAARLVLQAGAIGRNGEVLLLDMGEPVRIVDLAADMIRLSGFEVGVDIDIEFTGLRPGEKLFEELHVHGETPLPTRHPKITMVDHQHRDPVMVIALVNRLIESADDDPAEVLELLGQLVPSYAENRQSRQHVRLVA